MAMCSLGMRGLNVYVVAQGPYVGRRLAAGFSSLGASVALLTDEMSGVDAITTEFHSRPAIQSAFRRASQRFGQPHLVVISALPRRAVAVRPVAQMDDDDWRTACRDLIRVTLHGMQVAADSFTTAGSIVVVGPALTFSGSADLVPLSTASEAQRGLVKSAARQWAERGIRLNWVGVSATQLTQVFADARLPFRPEKVPRAVGHALDIEREIPPIIAFLSSQDGGNMSGASLCLDGGEWLVP